MNYPYFTSYSHISFRFQTQMVNLALGLYNLITPIPKIHQNAANLQQLVVYPFTTCQSKTIESAMAWELILRHFSS